MIRKSHRPISAAVRWGFTAWMVLWVTVILTHQGPQNFIWLCNLAQFITLWALWRGNVLLASSQVGTVSLVGVVWSVDLLVGLASGGQSHTGFTAYMFNDDLALIVRLTSLYHIGLPILLLWAVARLGYDWRGPWLQCVISALAVIAAWLLTEPHRNVNWVFYPFGVEQDWMPEFLWVGVLLIAYPLLIIWPGHFLVRGLLWWVSQTSDADEATARPAARQKRR